MNAPVIQLVPRETDESRRQRTIADMRHGLHSLGLELQRISMLGDEEAAVAMKKWTDRAQHQVNRGETLREEFIELAETGADDAE